MTALTSHRPATHCRKRRPSSRNTNDVGYGNPPKKNRFKPGQSGNPKGRPKGAKSAEIILRTILNRKIAIRESGKTRKITVLEAMFLKFAEEGLKGNPKAAAFLLNRYAMESSGEEPGEIHGDDQEILEAFTRKLEAKFRHRKEKP